MCSFTLLSLQDLVCGNSIEITKYTNNNTGAIRYLKNILNIGGLEWK